MYIALAVWLLLLLLFLVSFLGSSHDGENLNRYP